MSSKLVAIGPFWGGLEARHAGRYPLSVERHALAQDFRDDQQRSWVESVVAAMKMDADLAEQAAANNEPQFLASPTLRDAVALAVAETGTAHARMTDLYHARKDIEIAVIESLGKLLYLDLHEGAGV